MKTKGVAGEGNIQQVYAEINPSWHSIRSGLLSGQGLMVNLQQMDYAYLQAGGGKKIQKVDGKKLKIIR